MATASIIVSKGTDHGNATDRRNATVLTYDKILDPGAVCHFDLGALCYGIVLAAWDRGLGSVINGQGIMRSDIVREVANIPEDEVIMTCVAMGYPDDSFPANAVRSDREPKTDCPLFRIMLPTPHGPPTGSG